MGLIFCYLFFYCLWATSAHRCLCSLSVLPPMPGRHAPCAALCLTLGKGFSSGTWGAAGHGAAVGAQGHCHDAAPALSISAACSVCPGNEGTMESLRLVMVSKPIVSNCPCSTAEAPLPPDPLCHACTVFKPLQLWGLCHLATLSVKKFPQISHLNQNPSCFPLSCPLFPGRRD